MKFTSTSTKVASLLFVLFLVSAAAVNAQQLAFPTAEGAGRFTTGGRGTSSVATTVYEVTRLDDPTPTVVGTLRYATTSNSSAVHRTVVFRISGTIHLTSKLSLNKNNTTIAGQTAPGDGICIADYPVSISADNLIIRYIRVRLGDKNQLTTTPAGCGVPTAPFTAACAPMDGSGDGDALSGTGHTNIIIDHCTMSWSDDESLTIYSGDLTTAQWNIISEPLDYSYHFEGGDTDFEHHAYAGIWGGRHATYHHNLIAHVKGRAPRFDGSRNLGSVVGAENVDFRNNVIYDWVDYNTNGGEGGNYNVVNNYYKYGPNTLNSATKGVNRRSMIINPYYGSTSLPYGKYYLMGNYSDNSATVTNDNWLGAAMNNGSTSNPLADTTQAKVTTPFDIAPLNTEAALDAYNSVLNNAGAILPRRDTLDERIVNDVRNRTGRIIDVQGGYPHGTPYAQTVNAWPTLNSTTASADTDHDGMPDAWETSMGLDPNNAADRNTYTANGYTQLENYLNGITAALPLTLVSFKASIDSKDVVASWSTANEINTKNFEVERSVDGRNFSSIGSVTAVNNVQNNNYTFRDVRSLNGVSYYRLKMIDKDGSYIYSPVVKLSRQTKNVLAVAPNPAVNNVTIVHPTAGNGATIEVFNADGKKLNAINLNAGSTKTTIQVSSYKSGIYYLLFANDTEQLTSQFFKK